MVANSSDPDFDAPIPAAYTGQRLDRALAAILPAYSRSRLQHWLTLGVLTVDGATPPAKTRVAGGEWVCLHVPTAHDTHAVAGEPIPLSIIHEDESIIVLDKPAGLVMHPGAGNPAGTLQNALVGHAPALAALPRAGIVHRLDKDTSGILVVAKTFAAHQRLVADLAARRITREYEAVTVGVMTAGACIDAPIGRHPRARKRMTVRDDGRRAVTHYRVIQRYRAHTHIHCRLETGRTHQIRVHLAHRRYPLLGDATYGRRLALPAGADEAFIQTLRQFKRQALHAARLGLAHPQTGEAVVWCAPRPPDLEALLDVLATDLDTHSR